jgi:hypothetical protein
MYSYRKGFLVEAFFIFYLLAIDIGGIELV